MAIAAYIQQDGALDLSPRNPKALVTGYDFLQDSARRIEEDWGNAFTPEDVDGRLISGDWDVATVDERRNLLATALAQAPGFMSLNGHATHFEEGVPGINRFDIQGLPATDIATLDLTGSVVYAVGCHGGLPVPDEADLPQSFLGAGTAAYLAGSGYGWGLLEGIGLGERLAVIFTEELAAPGPQSIGDVIRRGKERYYFSEDSRWDAYDAKTLHQPILYGFPMYTFEIGAPPPLSPPPVRVTRGASRSQLPPHIVALQVNFDFTAEGVYRKYDVDGLEITDCPPEGCYCPAEGCYYELNGLASGESDLPIEPYFRYNSSLASTSQHGILWLGGPYLEESDWTPIFGQLASNDQDNIDLGSTPPRIIIPPRGPRPVGPADAGGLCPAQDDEVNSVVVTTGELVKAEGDGLDEYSLHRLAQEVDLEIFYFNNQDNPSENCDREGPVFGEGEPHQLLGTTLHWSVDVQDGSGVWRVLVIWDDELTARWSPLELSYDEVEERWIDSLPAAGRNRLAYVLQAVDRHGNVAWKELVAEVPPSGVHLGLADVVEVEIDEGEADLDVTLIAPSEAGPGAAFTATLRVVNHGPDPANQLTATLTLPPGMVYTFGGSDSWTCSLNASDILCTRDVLESGDTSDIFILLVAPSLGGEYLLSACVDAAEGDPTGPSCDEVWILVPEYPLVVTKAGVGTVTSHDAGIACGVDCDHEYVGNSAVRLMAVPAPGWVFDSWSGDCIGSGFCELTMDSAKSVEAVFARPDGLAVIYSPSPFGYVSLASLGVEPFDCPTLACDDTGWLLEGLDFYGWGQHVDSVSWVTNGYIYLDSSGTATPANQEMPDPVVPNAVLAPFWSNLDLDGGDAVGGGTWYLANLTDGNSTWHVFEWENAEVWALDGSSYSFQIWIEVGTSNIWFTYGSMSPEPPAAVTVGAEDDAGGEGFLFYHNGAVLPPEAGTELRVVAPGYCAGITDLEVTVQVLGTMEAFEACNSITVGPELDVVFPGEVTLSSGGTVDFKDGFAVHSGAQLRVISGPATGSRSALSISQDVATPQAVGTVGIE